MCTKSPKRGTTCKGYNLPKNVYNILNECTYGCKYLRQLVEATQIIFFYKQYLPIYTHIVTQFFSYMFTSFYFMFFLCHMQPGGRKKESWQKYTVHSSIIVWLSIKLDYAKGFKNLQFKKVSTSTNKNRAATSSEKLFPLVSTAAICGTFPRVLMKTRWE